MAKLKGESLFKPIRVKAVDLRMQFGPILFAALDAAWLLAQHPKALKRKGHQSDFARNAESARKTLRAWIAMIEEAERRIAVVTKNARPKANVLLMMPKDVRATVVKTLRDIVVAKG